MIFRAYLSSLLEFRLGRGETIFLIGYAAHAFYTPFVHKFHQGVPGAMFAFNMTAFGTILLVAFGWQEIEEDEPWDAFDQFNAGEQSRPDRGVA